MRKINSSPAYSLIYALVITTIIMIVATTAVQGTLSKLTYYNDVLSAKYAKYAGESAIDKAILAIKDYEAGYEPDSYSDTAPDGIATMEYSVISRAQPNNGSSEFYTPIPMTGTAAPSDECDYLASADEDVDHACNWNKIMYGQSVTIPLYSYDGGAIKNPNDLGLTEWNLKVRTPCTDGTYGETCARYELDGDSGDYENDESIILWQLIGEDSSGDTVVTVVPDDGYSTDRRTGVTSRTTATNTEIYESLINDASPSYSVLTTSSESDGTSLLDICKDGGIDKLYLQLSIVNPLIDKASATDESVPYLEWQLESTLSVGAFADNKAVVIGKGYYEGQSGTFYYPSVITRTTVGERTATYTISN